VVTELRKQKYPGNHWIFKGMHGARAKKLDNFLTQWFGRSLLCWLFQPRVEGYRVEPGILLQTVGSKTSKLSRVVLAAWEMEPQEWIICASNYGKGRDPHWAVNLRAHPLCWIWSGRKMYPSIAEECSGEDLERVRQYVHERAPHLDLMMPKAHALGRDTIPYFRIKPVASMRAERP